MTEEGSGKGAGTVGGEGDVSLPCLGASAGGGVEGDGGEGDARMATEGEGGGGGGGCVVSDGGVGGEVAEACWWDESGFRKKRPGFLSLDTIKVCVN